MAKWNRRSLLMACEDLLHDPRVELRLRTITTPNITAHVTAEYEDDNQTLKRAVVTLDPAQGGLIECALHELLHIVLDKEAGSLFNALLEEKIIKTMEVELFAKAIKPKDAKRWRKIINDKLEA
jgi:hypothetical protein